MGLSESDRGFGELPPRRVGPHVVAGRLFFAMPDGETISCECIRDPYASQIFALFNGEFPDQPTTEADEIYARCIVESLVYIGALKP